MVTSRAVVGSSAISSAGSAGQRHGDHHPLAHARRTAGAGRRPGAARAAGCPRPCQELATACLPRPAWPRPWCRRMASIDLVADRVHRVERGHGLLEDHRHLAAAQVQHGPLGGGEDVLAEHGHRAAGHPEAALHQQAHGRHGGHRLAGAGLAHDPDDLPGPHLQGDAVEGLDRALVDGELEAEVVDGQDVRWVHGQFCRLGSSTSRRPSPNRLKPVAVIRMAKPGKAEYHHWSRM